MTDSIRTLVYAALIALVIRCFAFEPFSIPSASMVPTLEVGDFLFVSKSSYGYSTKSSFFGLPLFDGRVGEDTIGHKPKRGDVVVFKLPKNPSVDYIKRLIGLPGDRIQVQHGRLYINGAMVEREEIGHVETVREGDVLARKAIATDYREILPDEYGKADSDHGKTHIIREEGDERALDNMPEFMVPDGHYFMMGDNRDNSLDSRVASQVGFVPEENLVGPARVIFFSLEDTRFWEFWKWPTAIRFDRLFDRII